MCRDRGRRSRQGKTAARLVWPAQMLLWLAVMLVSCDDPPANRSTQKTSAAAQSGLQAVSSTAASATGLPAAREAGAPAGSATAFAHPPARTDGCPKRMIRVEGDYCPGLIQRCLKHHEEYERNPDSPTVSERCLVYEKPTRCVSVKRRRLSFCMDRYEYPNQLGELPWVLTSWLQAKWLCEQQGKRLCTEDEYNFACEGPDGLPYVYGFERDAGQCNIDQPYIQPDHSRAMLTYRKCLADAECKRELERLDGRHRIGSRLTCVSWAGVVDLNGNVNEWVERPGEEPPHRSGLKGGWWGPVRCRCRPTVQFHKEYDYGYEAGFRCCHDADRPLAIASAAAAASGAGASPVTARSGPAGGRTAPRTAGSGPAPSARAASAAAGSATASSSTASGGKPFVPAQSSPQSEL